MSRVALNKKGKRMKLYREAYRYQDLGMFLLNYLSAPNTLDGTLNKARSICGLWLDFVAEKFISRIKERDGYQDFLPCATVAFNSIASIVHDRKKYKELIAKKMHANVWKG